MFELKLENSNGAIVNINDEVNYVVLSASGLNPPSASLFTSKSPNRKGLRHNGSTLDERNITIKIKLLGDIENSRIALYEWCNTEQYVKVHFKNNSKEVYCEGYVEDCEVDQFTDSEIVELAILCPNPYWKALEEISTAITSLISQFTFPFAIDSAGEPFSTKRETNDTVIYNAGAETGLIIRAFFKAPAKNLVIYDSVNTNRRFAINMEFETDSIVTIDTDSSPKTCKMTSPNGDTVNILRYVGNNPYWFSLKQGSNTFGFTAEQGEDDIELTFAHTNKYLGV